MSLAKRTGDEHQAEQQQHKVNEHFHPVVALVLLVLGVRQACFISRLSSPMQASDSGHYIMHIAHW